MRFTHLLALATVSGAVTVSAQEPRASGETRIRATSPRIYGFDTEPGHRAAIGIGTTTTGTLRDTLGVMITSITKGSPAEKAGLEEGNRIAAINGVSLRVNAADVEDREMSSALTRRLSRELAKSKPGDEVELRVYRDGRTSSIKLRTADSDDLFKRVDFVRQTRSELENRPALGFSLGSTGSRRDTLGVLVMSVSDSSPASKAGIEEGNRIAAIGGVNLRVPREDAGDRWLSSTKSQRLQREIAALKPGEDVTLKVYSNGQFRDVTLKVARAGDLPRGSGGMMYFNGDAFIGGFPGTPAMPMMPSVPRLAPMADFDYHVAMPEVRRAMEGVRMQLDDIAPGLEGIGPRVQMELDAIRPQLDRLRMEAPRVQMHLDAIRPQLERIRMEAPRVQMHLDAARPLIDRVRIQAPRIRTVNVIV